LLLLLLFIYTVTVLLEVAVESLSLGAGGNENDDGIAYVRAVCDFRHLVLSDFERCLTNVCRALSELYGCSSVRPMAADDDAGSVVLELRQAMARVVALQCDHSSGHLARELKRLLITPSALAALGVSEVNITTDLKTVR